MAYFNNDHFKPLNKLQGAVYHGINPEQQRVHEVGQAYDVTKRWAEALQQLGFKIGRTGMVRTAADSSGKAAAYNRTQLYSDQHAHKGLDDSGGFDAAPGLVVKIDRITTQVDDFALGKNYEQIRGGFTPSPIASVKSIPNCRAMDFAGLVEWSANAIK